MFLSFTWLDLSGYVNICPKLYHDECANKLDNYKQMEHWARDQSWVMTSRYLYLIQSQGNESSIFVTRLTCQGIAINKFVL